MDQTFFHAEEHEDCGPALLLADAICQKFAEGNFLDAFAEFTRLGGMCFALLHGYRALERIIAAAPAGSWRDHEEFLGAYCLYLAKRGQAARALAMIHDGGLTFERSFKLELSELLLSIHLGHQISAQKISIWRQLEARLPESEPLLHGLYHNAMMVNYSRRGQISQAKTTGAMALQTYGKAQHVYLEHFIHVHLADLNLLEGRLKQARRHLATAEVTLRNSGRTYRNELDLIAIQNLYLDYETGRMEHIPEQASILRASLVSGDSWAEIFLKLCRIEVLSLYFNIGYNAAQECLESCRADYHHRHGAFSTTLDLIGAELVKLDHNHSEFEALMARISPDNLDSPLGQVLLTNLQAIVVAEGLPGHEMAQNHLHFSDGPRGDVVRELVAAGRVRGDATQCRRRVEKAMRLAVHEGMVAVFLEHRDTVARVSAQLADGKFARGHTQLSRMARQIHRAIRSSYAVPPELAKLGLGRKNVEVLRVLETGASNKEIARRLGITEATVKYHVTSLFKAFSVKRRGEVIEKSSEFQIIF